MRRDPQRLQDILDALDWISKSVTDRDEGSFLADETLCYAIAQKLTIIGEATARLGAEIKLTDESIPWKDIVGLRNILVHEYFGIYWPLVWQTAVDQVPELRGKIAALLASYPPESERMS